MVARYRELVLSARIDLAKLAFAAGPPSSLADDDSEKKLHENLMALVAGSVDRAREGAQFVETAAAAIGTVYTGVLGLVFAASSRTLPSRGIYSAVFLGIAIVGAAYYLAFIRQIRPIGRPVYVGSRAEDQWRRTEYFSAWASTIVRNRAWALRAAVVSLAFGVVFLPLPLLPDRVVGVPFVSNQAVPVAPASAVPIDWPSPPTIANSDLAAVLYKAQIEHFEKTLPTSQSLSDGGAGVATDALAGGGFIGAALVVSLIAFWSSIRAFWLRLKALAARLRGALPG